YDTRRVLGTSRSAAPRGASGRAAARVRRHRPSAPGERRPVRLSRRHGVSGAPPPRGRRHVAEQLERGRGPPPPGLRADDEGREGARRPPPRLGELREERFLSAGGRVSGLSADWLAELAASLRGPRRACRRLVAELEGHLEDAVAGGLSEADAVARLGPAFAVAGRWNAESRRRRWQARAQILAAALAIAAVAAPVGLAQRPGQAPRHRINRPASSP